MQKHGIVLDEKAQEQPADKDRAQPAHKTEPGDMPSQPVTKKDDEPTKRSKAF
jgi:hypothetical protein